MAEEVDLTKVKPYLGLATDDTAQDDLLKLVYADTCSKVESYLNQDNIGGNVKLPATLDWIVRDLVIKRYNRLGDEGKISSSESDVSASWNTDDLDEFTIYLDPIRNRKGGKGIARFF